MFILECNTGAFSGPGYTPTVYTTGEKTPVCVGGGEREMGGVLLLLRCLFVDCGCSVP